MSDRQGLYIGRDLHHVSSTWNVSKGLMHDIDRITIDITFKVNGFLNDMNILYVLYWQLHIEVICVFILFLYLYLIFTPFYINDGTALFLDTLFLYSYI